MRFRGGLKYFIACVETFHTMPKLAQVTFVQQINCETMPRRNHSVFESSSSKIDTKLRSVFLQPRAFAHSYFLIIILNMITAMRNSAGFVRTRTFATVDVDFCVLAIVSVR